MSCMLIDKANEGARLGQSAIFLSDSEETECDDINLTDSSYPVADNNSDEFAIQKR